MLAGDSLVYTDGEERSNQNNLLFDVSQRLDTKTCVARTAWQDTGWKVCSNKTPKAFFSTNFPSEMYSPIILAIWQTY
jgi:hypothetical protein